MKDPDTVRLAVKQVVVDYFGDDTASINAVSIDATYSSYYQQDKNWKCRLSVDFDKSKLSEKDISELKRLISDVVKGI